MKRRSTSRRASMIAPIVAALAVGIVLGWLLRAYGPPRPANLVDTRDQVDGDRNPEEDSALRRGRTSVAVATAGPPSIVAPPAGVEPGGAVEVLRHHTLRVPIDGANVDSFKGGFLE